MDHSEAEAIVRREVKPMLELLGVGHWQVTVHFAALDLDPRFGTRARVFTYPAYDKAVIEMDPPAFRDEADLIESLRHEVFHILLAPFDVLMETLGPALKHDDVLAETLQSVRQHACEQAVINLERLYDNLTSTRSAKKGIPIMKAKSRTAAAPVAASKGWAASPGMKKPKGTKKGGVCK
jgi:hypothetical protein